MKKLLIYIFLASAVGISGCKKFLGQEPDNRTTITTPDQVTQLLTSAYPHGNYITFCEVMSDNAEDKGAGNTDLIDLQPYFFQDVQSTDLDSPTNYWYAAYKAISAANQALEVIDQLPNKGAYQAQQGEALVARAYSHFMLVTLFSKAYDATTAASDPGIPYVLTPETHVFEKYDRKTVQYVYDMIEKDLTQGLPLIDDKIYAEAPKFHFTQKAAHAFAARFYLFKKNYAQVVAHANLAVTGTLTDNLRPWNTTYLSLQYYDLQATYTKSTERANILLQEANSLWGRNYASYRYSLGNNIVTTVLNGTNVTGGQLAIGYRIFGADPSVYNVPKFYEHFVYSSATANIGDPYNTIPLLTAEEVLFNRAESNIQLHQYAAALTDLNTWVSKNVRNYNVNTHTLTSKKIVDFYKMPTDTAGAMIKAVLDLKRPCYIHEGIRWFDILRLKMPVTHTTSTGQILTLAPDDKRKLLQLPSEVKLSGIDLNPR
jgi:hypothetical protein